MVHFSKTSNWAVSRVTDSTLGNFWRFRWWILERDFSCGVYLPRYLFPPEKLISAVFRSVVILGNLQTNLKDGNYKSRVGRLINVLF